MYRAKQPQTVRRFYIGGVTDMPHWWNETITVYHQTISEDGGRRVRSWTASVLTDCFFTTKTAQALNGNTLSLADSYLVRIPYTGRRLYIAAGDLVFRGRVCETIGDEQGKRETDLLRRYRPDCFTVRTVSDNTRTGHLPHYKLTGV